MECTVYRRGTPVGRLTITGDGLYRVFRAEIAADTNVLRLYAPEKLGVFVPEGGMLVCRRRISRARFSAVPQWACAWCEADGQWTDAPNGTLCRYLPEGRESAVPLGADGPILFPAAPEKLRLIMVGGRPFLSAFLPYPLS